MVCKFKTSSTPESPSPKSLGAVSPARCPVLTCYDKCGNRCNAAKHAKWEIWLTRYAHNCQFENIALLESDSPSHSLTSWSKLPVCMSSAVLWRAPVGYFGNYLRRQSTLFFKIPLCVNDCFARGTGFGGGNRTLT